MLNNQGMLSKITWVVYAISFFTRRKDARRNDATQNVNILSSQYGEHFGQTFTKNSHFVTEI